MYIIHTSFIKSMHFTAKYFAEFWQKRLLINQYRCNQNSIQFSKNNTHCRNSMLQVHYTIFDGFSCANVPFNNKSERIYN